MGLTAVLLCLVAFPGEPALDRLARLDPDSPAAPTAPAEPAEYVVEAAARSTTVFLLPPGPRTIRSLEVVPTPATMAAWRGARLGLTWEDDDTAARHAAVDLPLPLAFGRVGSGLVMNPAAFGSATDSWECRLPMPYKARALLRIETESPIEGRVRLKATPGVPASPAYLHAASLADPGGSSRRLEKSSRGHLAGIFSATIAEPSVGSLVVDLDGRPIDGFKVPAWFLDAPRRFQRGFSVASTASVQTPLPVVVFWYSERPGPGGQSQ